MNLGRQTVLAFFLAAPFWAAAQSAVPLSGVVERTGTFQSLAASTSGTVVVFRNRDGTTHLLLHKFSTSASSGLQVWLSKSTPQQGSRNPVSSDLGLRLGSLTQFKGNFEFALPSGVDMSAGFRSVVLWSDPQKKVLAVALLN
ncbi:DM13 domain-containing protein [Deinococcus oregonensis]|uniref:DM13 domain-containing protein n=1 Tax=Deinococcus oregonensis TaxID=1805970 RepID=A0ABV6AY45_9DEIO